MPEKKNSLIRSGDDHGIRGLKMPHTEKLTSDYGAEITITSQIVLLKEPDRLGGANGLVPGDLIELSMLDIHNITRCIQEKFGVDITKEDFRQQFKC